MSEAVDAIRRAFAAAQQGRLAEADDICRALLAQDPSYAPALRLGGVVAAELGRVDDAIDLMSRALARDPADAQTRSQLGVVLRVRADAGLRRSDMASAVADYDRALACDAANADTHYNRANALFALNRDEEAVRGYDRAVELRPRFAQAWQNRGVALSRLGRHGDAIASLDRALALDAASADAWINRGNALRALDRDDEAQDAYARAMAIAPGFEFLRGTWLHARMTVCDWSGIDQEFAQLAHGIAAGEHATPPFPALSMLSSPSILHAASRTWAAARFPERRDVPPRVERTPGGKIRVGYFAATFHEHATAYLMAQLFEAHDREAFETTAFSFGPQTGDAMRARVAGAFDRFVEIGARSDAEAAMLAREAGIDIAVDLMGYTRDGRPGIFACRAAPVQAAYLGYPGTMGAPYVDYAIVDRVVVPESQRGDYDEKLVYLPGCYQVNDARRPRPEAQPGREEAGLPRDAFVYCCFNNNFKLTPRMFDVWSRILRGVDHSVLWLIADNAWAASNLRKEAHARGVDPARLVFAPRVPLEAHLARHRLADLFLDTLPYNAHTTASDALWMGVPVLTCMGESFAGRVAASLLHAVGMPELVMPTLEAYEARAVELARDTQALRAVRDALAAKLRDAPLFDGRRFARDLEAAYRAMHARHAAGLPPDHIETVPAPRA
jgi:predicted O-linked N-acetylglucosamine transferase (SPINDLY family)